MGGITQHTVFAFDPRADAAPDTLLRIEMPADNEITMGPTIKVKVDMRVPRLHLSGDGSGRILLAASDTYRIRVLRADGKTSGWLTRPASRQRYTSAEQARKKQQADSLINAGLRGGVAALPSGRGVPRPEMEFVPPEYAPVLSGLVAGDRYVLVLRSSEDDGKPRDYDLLSYDGRLAGTLKLPARFRARVLRDNRIYGIEKDELDIESVAVYRIAAPR
jgi:hypothetical protein